MAQFQHGQVAPTEMSESLLGRAAGDLDGLADNLFSEATRLNAIADRAFGPPPPRPASNGPQPGKSNCGMDNLNQQIDRVRLAYAEISAATDRFNSLA